MVIETDLVFHNSHNTLSSTTIVKMRLKTTVYCIKYFEITITVKYTTRCLWILMCSMLWINLLTPNDNYSVRTAPLTSKVAFYIFIQQIQVLNILNMVYSLRFFFSSKCSLFHNSNVFYSCIIHILYTGCAKIKKIIPAPKG